MSKKTCIICGRGTLADICISCITAIKIAPKDYWDDCELVRAALESVFEPRKLLREDEE